MLLIYEPKHTALVTEMETMEAEVKALITSNATILTRSVNNTNVQEAATAQLSAASEKLNDLRIAVSESNASYDEKKDLVKKLTADHRTNMVNKSPLVLAIQKAQTDLEDFKQELNRHKVLGTIIF